jgi:hypothetical protein
MARRVTGEKILEDMSSGGGINYREVMVSLGIDKQTRKTVTKKLRLIGLPIEFWEASAKKRSPDDPKKFIPFDFPDKDVNKSYARICDDDPENDYWTQNGYAKTKKYAINCIDRDDGKIKILAKGKSIFREFYKAENSNKEDNIEMKESGDPLLWEMIGGEEAPDVKILAVPNDERWGGAEYEVHINPRVNKITSEEIEKLRAIGAPTDAELKDIRKQNPDLAECPDWFFYGYDLEKIFKPTPPKISSAARPAEDDTLPEEMDIPVDEAEEIEEDKETSTPDPAPAPGKAKKGSKTAVAEAEEETKVESEEENAEPIADMW